MFEIRHYVKKNNRQARDNLLTNPSHVRVQSITRVFTCYIVFVVYCARSGVVGRYVINNNLCARVILATFSGRADTSFRAICVRHSSFLRPAVSVNRRYNSVFRANTSLYVFSLCFWERSSTVDRHAYYIGAVLSVHVNKLPFSLPNRRFFKLFWTTGFKWVP